LQCAVTRLPYLKQRQVEGKLVKGGRKHCRAQALRELPIDKGQLAGHSKLGSAAKTAN
jgi:hypothetical protein